MERKGELLYQRFLNTAQETVRLTAALEGCSGHICCWRPPAACGSYGGNEGENSRKFRQ